MTRNILSNKAVKAVRAAYSLTGTGKVSDSMMQSYLTVRRNSLRSPGWVLTDHAAEMNATGSVTAAVPANALHRLTGPPRAEQEPLT